MLLVGSNPTPYLSQKVDQIVQKVFLRDSSPAGPRNHQKKSRDGESGKTPITQLQINFESPTGAAK